VELGHLQLPDHGPKSPVLSFAMWARWVHPPFGSQPLLMVQVVTLATGEATELTVDGHAVTVRTDHNGPSWTPDAALLVNRFD
jgi:hypothetical protein